MGTLEHVIADLRRELEDEWTYNHDEHCTNRWPHGGSCHWPRPPILDDPAVTTIPELPPHADAPYLRRPQPASSASP